MLFPTPKLCHHKFTALALNAVILCSTLSAAETLDLAGQWRVQLDGENNGAVSQWFARPLPASSITLPGSLPGAGIGDPIAVDTKWTGGIFDKSYFSAPEYVPYRESGNIKVPFWLQPETHYVGAAWFQRDIDIPTAWNGRHVVLSLERPHWKTTVWLDNREIGSNDALSVAHEYNLGASVTPGTHRLTIRVDNTLNPDIGENSHSVTDHTQGNWNGIVGRIELKATAPVWIDDLQIKSRIKGPRGHCARTTCHLRSAKFSGKSLCRRRSERPRSRRGEGGSRQPRREFFPRIPARCRGRVVG